MIEYRLSKYNPAFRDSRGVYHKDEWTAISDIGKKYASQIFTYEEYYKTESNYVNVIIDLFKQNEIIDFRVSDLEDYSGVDNEEYFKDIKKLDIKNLTPQLKIDEIENIIRLGLRELIWLNLVGKNSNCKIIMHFGHDYYVKFNLDHQCRINKDVAEKKGLYFEKENR